MQRDIKGYVRAPTRQGAAPDAGTGRGSGSSSDGSSLLRLLGKADPSIKAVSRSGQPTYQATATSSGGPTAAAARRLPGPGRPGAASQPVPASLHSVGHAPAQALPDSENLNPTRVPSLLSLLKAPHPAVAPPSSPRHGLRALLPSAPVQPLPFPRQPPPQRPLHKERQEPLTLRDPLSQLLGAGLGPCPAGQRRQGQPREWQQPQPQQQGEWAYSHNHHHHQQQQQPEQQQRSGQCQLEHANARQQSHTHPIARGPSTSSGQQRQQQRPRWSVQRELEAAEAEAEAGVLLVLGDSRRRHTAKRVAGEAQPGRDVRPRGERERDTGRRFNHWDDGAGSWDCDTLGIDGADDCDLRWEGVGTTAVGPRL